MKNEPAAAKAVEKTLRGKVQKQTFPRSLEIPQRARYSHFSHSLDCYWVLCVVDSLAPAWTGDNGSPFYRRQHPFHFRSRNRHRPRIAHAICWQ
jgi:hypothetical protein